MFFFFNQRRAHKENFSRPPPLRGRETKQIQFFRFRRFQSQTKQSREPGNTFCGQVEIAVCSLGAERTKAKSLDVREAAGGIANAPTYYHPCAPYLTWVLVWIPPPPRQVPNKILGDGVGKYLFCTPLSQHSKRPAKLSEHSQLTATASSCAIATIHTRTKTIRQRHVLSTHGPQLRPSEHTPGLTRQMRILRAVKPHEHFFSRPSSSPRPNPGASVPSPEALPSRPP